MLSATATGASSARSHHRHAVLHDDDESVPVTELRPTGLVEPRGPQERVQRHIMEQLGELAPMVQILDAPLTQMVDKLEDVLKIVDLFVPAQEIEVPLSSSSLFSS